jgi:uncharacterized protein YgiM (DUF1202 family)
MKKMIWTMLGTMVAASLLAQDNTNSLPAYPAPVSTPTAESVSAPAPGSEMTDTNIPAAKPVKHIRRHKAVKRKPAAPEPMVTLTPGPAEVNAADLVVRGQAGLKGEMLTHLHKDDTVTVLEQINLSHHAAGEPSQWARISYPTNTGVWVFAKYVDANGIVSTKKLNLRAGPSENYSVVGVLEKGTPVNPIKTKGDWTKIEVPTNAYAFVAARYLTAEAAPTPPAASPTEAPEAPPTPTTVPEQPPVVVTPPPAPEPPQPVQPPQPETPPVRIVEHEGIIGSVGSVIAPTDYKLYDLHTKQDIDFLYPTTPDIAAQLKNLQDADVIVTGEEGIDSRWPNTPVMAIQNVQVIATNVIKRFSRADLIPPRQRH